MWRLILTVKLIGSRIGKSEPSAMSVRDYLDQGNSGGKFCPKCVWYRSTHWGPRLNRKETVSWVHTSITASYCEGNTDYCLKRLLPWPSHHDGLYPPTPSWNKPFLLLKKRGRKKVRTRGQGASGQIVSSGYHGTAALVKSQQLWWPAQNHGSQHSSTEGEGSRAPHLIHSKLDGDGKS